MTAAINALDNYLPAANLPRKLKKRLKVELMRRIHPSWKRNEVRVLAYRVRNGRKVACSYTLDY